MIVAVVTLVRDARLRRSWTQHLVNSAAIAGPTGASLVVLHLLAPSGSWPGYAGALVAAAVTFTLLNELLLGWVIAAATGGRLLPTILADAATTGVGLLVNILLGLAVLAAVATGQWAIVLAVPLVLTMIVRRYRRRLLLDTTADALPRLRQAAERLEALDASEAVAEVLSRAAALFAVERIQLVLLHWPGEGDRTHTLTVGAGVESTRGRPAAAQDPNVLTVRLLSGPADASEVLGELRPSRDLLPWPWPSSRSWRRSSRPPPDRWPGPAATRSSSTAPVRTR